MKTRITMFVMLLISMLTKTSTAEKISPASDSITAAALDYAEGYYSGDPARMAKAIHFDLNKAYPRYLPGTGKVALSYSTYSMLVELCSAKTGLLPDTARHIKTEILYNSKDVALVKITSSKFDDYLQLVMINGEWKIVNVLWNIPGSTQWIKNPSHESGEAEIKTTIAGYLRGIQQGDIASLRDNISEDYNRLNIMPVGKDGRSAILRTRYDGMIENTVNGNGREDGAQRDNSFEILDMMDGMAVVNIKTATYTDYVQLYRDSEKWLVLNSMVKPNEKDLADFLPAIVGEPMPEFTLPVYGGGEYSYKGNKGKNVLLMFPRGWLGNNWCLFCQYQYLELTELEKKKDLRKKYDLDIVFVLPYSSEKIGDWFDKLPDALKTLDRIKNPSGDQISASRKQFAEWTKTHYPNTFDLSTGVDRKFFPVLIDDKQVLSKRLKLYTDYWDGRASDQNISAIYIIDKKGILRWKYISQMTEDRPSMEFLLNTLKEVCE